MVMTEQAISRLKAMYVLQETEESISQSTESGEAPTAATTAIPVSIVVPTFPAFTDSGRGDSMGYSDYKKSIIYVESNAIEKEPSPYKFYDDKMGMNLVSKKSGATFEDNTNDIDKTLKVYKVYTVLRPSHSSRMPASSALPVSKLSPASKPTALSRPKALQVHEEMLEEDTSTPDVESQGLDTSSGTQDEASLKQAAADEAVLESGAPAAEGPVSQSESQSDEQEAAAAEGAAAQAEGESTSADSDGTSESASASQEEDESKSSQSSEESAATATAGAADSDESDESEESMSDSNSDEQGPEPTSEAPIIVITAK